MKKIQLSKKRKEEIIKLYGHIPTKEEVFQKIIESQERLANALKGAWETKPQDSKTVKQLLEVGARSGKLRKELEKLIHTEEEKV